MTTTGCAEIAILVGLLTGCGHHPTPAATVAPRIVADFSSGKITLMGSLPDADSHDRLLAKARSLYGANHVVDQIAVDDRVSRAPWLLGDELTLALVDNTISDGQAAFDGQNLIITGRVPTATMRAQIMERTSLAAGATVTIQNHLQVSNSK